MVAVSSLLSNLRDQPVHLPGWAYGGVGAGIVLSGLLVLIVRSVADWQAARWASAGLAALFTAASWNLGGAASHLRGDVLHYCARATIGT
jgi:hypothetical protein